MVSVVLVLVVLIVSFGAPLGTPNTPTVSAQGDFTFEISPASPVSKGSILSFRVVANEGTTRINVDGNTFYELGAPAVNAIYDTNNLSVGWHTFCAQVRTSGGWENAATQCQDYEILANNGGNNSGGVNFYDYCRHIGYDRDGHDNNNAYTWRCVDGNRETGLNMYDVCDWLYGGRLPFPGLSDHRDPYSWSCNSTDTYIDPIDPPQNPDKDEDDGGNGGGGNNGGGNNGGGNSGESIPYTNAKVKDKAVVVNSPQGNGLLCKKNPIKGKEVNGSNDVIKTLYNGDTLTIDDGPWESQGLYFVKVTGDCNGYVATGVSGEPWIQKKSGSSGNGGSNGGGGNNGGGNGGSNNSNCTLSSPVQNGDTGQVTPGDPNRFRSGPGKDYDQIGSIPGGDKFSVTGNAQCNGGVLWIPIRYNGQDGWTAVGDDNEYWVVRFVSPIEQQGLLNPLVLTDELTNNDNSMEWFDTVPSYAQDAVDYLWTHANEFGAHTIESGAFIVEITQGKFQRSNLVCIPLGWGADTILEDHRVAQAFDMLCMIGGLAYTAGTAGIGSTPFLLAAGTTLLANYDNIFQWLSDQGVWPFTEGDWD